MNTIPASPRLSRRAALKCFAAAGVTAAGGYALATYPPWLNDAAQAAQDRRPFAQHATRSPMREIVRYATLAASGHNTQPWKFAIAEDAIDIYPDYTRHLPAVDPSDRELWISLGCALENLIVAARAAGYGAEVTYPTVATDFIHIDLTADTSQGGTLFDAIPLRQNTRSAYDGLPIATTDLVQVQALPLEPGVVLQLVTSPTERATVLEYVNQGNLRQYADTAFVAELIAWVRFHKPEALASLDGLYARSSGNPAVPRWLGQLVVAGTTPQQQADADATKLRSSPGAVVIASLADDMAAWVRTGQVYERMALTMTALNIKSAFLNQPIEVAAVRGQFQSAIGLGAALPQLLIRFGYAEPLPHSLRRPIEQVLVSA